MLKRPDRAVRRRQANRQNAQASTGPRTKRGKSRVRRNSLRHGLAAGPLAHKFPRRRTNALVQAIVGEWTDPEIRDAALEFVTTHLYWMRVAAVRQDILTRKLRERCITGEKNGHQVLILTLIANDPELVAIDRYERRAYSRRRRAATVLSSLRFLAAGN